MGTTGQIKLGIAGQPSSGKDTVAAYLVEKYGFTHISTGDFIRAYIKENNLGDLTRPFMRDTAAALRQKHGGDYLMQLALKDQHDRLIISGIRSLGEVETLKTVGGRLIALNVPVERRYEWAMARKRESDHISFEEFKKQQEKEEYSTDANDCNVNAVIKEADYILENFAGREELYKQIDDLLQKIL